MAAAIDVSANDAAVAPKDATFLCQGQKPLAFSASSGEVFQYELAIAARVTATMSKPMPRGKVGIVSRVIVAAMSHVVYHRLATLGSRPSASRSERATGILRIQTCPVSRAGE